MLHAGNFPPPFSQGETETVAGVCPKSLKHEEVRFPLVRWHPPLGHDPKVWGYFYVHSFLLTKHLFHEAYWTYFF